MGDIGRPPAFLANSEEALKAKTAQLEIHAHAHLAAGTVMQEQVNAIHHYQQLLANKNGELDAKQREVEHLLTVLGYNVPYRKAGAMDFTGRLHLDCGPDFTGPVMEAENVLANKYKRMLDERDMAAAAKAES